MLSKTVINSINTDISHIEGNISKKYPDNKIKKVGAFTDIEKDKKSTLFYINDIDIEIILQYYKNCNENIHYIISQFLSLDNPTINKVYKYIDMKTYLPKSIFKFPWFIKSIIDDKETSQTFCDYDKNETKNWVDNLKSNNVLNVSTDDLIKIDEILKNQIIQIENLVEIEFILTKYISFNWSLDDIKNGEKTFLNTKYKLEDIFKENNENGEMLLCTLLCSYNSIYFKFDITFTKQKEQTFEYKRQLYKYFNQDWYRIFKSVFKNIVRKNIDTQDKFTLGLIRDYNKTKMISSKLSLFSMLNTILETKILNIEQFNKFSEQLFIQFPSIENWDLYIKNIEKDLFVLCKNSIIKYNRLIGYYRRKEIRPGP